MAAAWRAARSSSLVRSAVASARGSDVLISSRAITLLHHPPTSGRRPPVIAEDDGASRRAQTRLQANRISTTPPRRKSAMSVPSPCVVVDNFGSGDDALPGGGGPAPDPMTVPFLLADIGEGISEVELLQWFVGPGDAVAQFDRVCEVQSDKASVEITSRFDGVVESLCGEVGDMMSVGRPLLYVATEGGAGRDAAAGQQDQQLPRQATRPTATLNNVDDEQDRLRIPSVGANYAGLYDAKSHGENAAPEAASRPREHPANSTAKVLTSPAVRKLGKEHNIDLRTVLGTGPGGRILKADVLKIIHSSHDISESPPPPPLALALETKPSPSTSVTLPQKDVVVPLRGYNRLMVKSMTSSLNVPHMVYCDDVDVHALTEARDALRAPAAKMGIPRLTYMPFFIKAASLALAEYPTVNSTIDVEGMTLTHRRAHDIGVAVDTERGLAVPVVRGCEGKSVLEIAAELGRLYSLAAEGNLSGDDISNPTFTLSNIGAIGGTYMSPVVLPPQVAIGAMGKVRRLPRFVNDDSDCVTAARIMPVSWGADHRAVDGATMARFGNLWKSYVENPSSMMLVMR